MSVSKYKSCGCAMDGPRFAKPCPQHRVHWIENEWLVPLAKDADVLSEVERLDSLHRLELGSIVRAHLRESRFDFPYGREPESFIRFLGLTKVGTV